MSREELLAEILRADATLTSILTGGIYTDEEIGVEGLRRSAGSLTENAFDEDGFIKPTAIVRQRVENPYPGLFSHRDKMVSMSQGLEIYFYQHTGHDQIDLARKRTFTLLQGERLGVSYPMSFVGESPYMYDQGAIYNALVLRQDWVVVFIRRPE